MPAPYEQFFLFGDSITQDSFNQERGFGWSAALQHAYIRRLDVVNRGFSGYNTRQALEVLTSIFPSPETVRIRFLVIFFGANDAAFPPGDSTQHVNQHIPLEEYAQNIEKIITHPSVAAHNARIILVTPPPINEHLLLVEDLKRGHKSVTRVAARTQSYADAACEVGERLGVPVINLWKAFMNRTGFNAETSKSDTGIPGSLDVPQNDALVELMYDGLHFNPAGYKILFQETMKLIEDKWPDQVPDSLPTVLPAWNDTAAWDAFKVSQ